MRILHVIRRHKGGVGTYVNEISSELKKLGHTVDIISREDDLKINSFSKSLISLKKQIKSKEYDIINAHDWSIGLPLRNLKNCVCTFHGYETFPKRILQMFIEKTKTTIVVSKQMNKIFPKSHLVEEGVNLQKFKPLRKRKKEKLIGFTQQPTSFYRFDKILESAKKINVPLLTTWKDFQKQGVISLGQIPHKNMNNFYSSLSAFISIPKHTGFNLSLLEAMACEVPTIGNLEGIGPELPILHVKNHSIDEISQRMLDALKLVGKTKYRKWIQKNDYTWKHSAKTLEAVYEKFLKN